MLANILIPLVLVGLIVVVICLAALARSRRAELEAKTHEIKAAKTRIAELEETLEKNRKVQANTPIKSKTTPLPWLNTSAAAPHEVAPAENSQGSHPGAPIDSNREDKYKALYYKLDEHIQLFSKAANECLEALARDLRHTDMPGSVRGILADLTVQLRRLNPLVNTDKLDWTIFGEKKEILDQPEESDSNSQGLRNVIIKQREIIHDLREKIAHLGEEDRKKYEEQLHYLEQALTESEQCVKTLEKELIAAKSQLEAKETQVARTQFLQHRISQLENHEKKLVQEVTELKNQYLKNSIATEREKEFVGRISDLKTELANKAEKLKKYQQQTSSAENEYLKLFDNYQNLIKKYGIKEGDDITLSSLPTEVILEVEELKAILKSKEFELDRTRSECKLLEASYLDIASNAEALEKARDELDKLRIENITLGEQLEKSMSAKSSTDEAIRNLNQLEEKYKTLKHENDINLQEVERLKHKEEELGRLRIEYAMMEEQFLNLALNSLK